RDKSAKGCSTHNVTATCSLLICQKGACAKRGSKELIAILEKAIRDRHLQDHVLIKATECLGCCKSAPVIVSLPDRNYHYQVQPEQIDQIIKEIELQLQLPSISFSPSTIEQEIKLGRASYHRDSLDNQVSQKILQPSYRF
ncbi:MAG: (2Fe-2S) ferredoxin domain-containing protein, partial [Pseudanabaena sp.]